MGLFTGVMEAESAEASEKAFRELIVKVRKERDLFDNPVKIFLDCIVKLSEIPKGGVVSWYSCYHHDGRSSISTSLPHKDVGGCMQYEYCPENRPDIDDRIAAGESFQPEPFVRFE